MCPSYVWLQLTRCHHLHVQTVAKYSSFRLISAQVSSSEAICTFGGEVFGLCQTPSLKGNSSISR
jgi:hypothetical protein